MLVKSRQLEHVKCIMEQIPGIAVGVLRALYRVSSPASSPALSPASSPATPCTRNRCNIGHCCNSPLGSAHKIATLDWEAVRCLTERISVKVTEKEKTPVVLEKG